jgi:hypothetical protein
MGVREGVDRRRQSAARAPLTSAAALRDIIGGIGQDVRSVLNA